MLQWAGVIFARPHRTCLKLFLAEVDPPEIRWMEGKNPGGGKGKDDGLETNRLYVNLAFSVV